MQPERGRRSSGPRIYIAFQHMPEREQAQKGKIMKGKLGSNVPMQPTIPKMPSNTSNALEALDSVNATQSNTLDCISRKAAIDKFKPWLKVEGYSPGEKNMLKAVLYELHCMPPTKLKRKKARFVYENGKLICERCGNEMRLIEQSGDLIFCPNCGAEREMKRL